MIKFLKKSVKWYISKAYTTGALTPTGMIPVQQ